MLAGIAGSMLSGSGGGMFGGGGSQEPAAPISVSTGPVSTSTGSGSFGVVGGDSLWIIGLIVVAIVFLKT